MEKPLKIMWNGKLLREVYPHATRFQVLKYKVKKFFRKVFIASGIGLASYSLFILGGALNPRVQIIEASVPREEIPVLARIAKCESGNNHFDKNGQVLVRGNNGSRASVDIGKYQINSMYWGKKATEMGLDLFNEKDNQTMAEYIYANIGMTDSWSATRSCWSK